IISGLYQRAFDHFSKAVQSAEEEIQLSCWSHEAAAEQAHAYMTLVGFCDQQLRKVEESASSTSQKRSTELAAYPALVVEKMLRALKLNSSEARLKFPRLLQIIEQYSEETLNLMTKEDWVNDTKDELGKNPVNKNNIEKLYKRMYTALGDLRTPGLGPFRRRFIQ
ncbi:hypothetical protein A6R68_19440, partial [Neotoma lepida]